MNYELQTLVSVLLGFVNQQWQQAEIQVVLLSTRVPALLQKKFQDTRSIFPAPCKPAIFKYGGQRQLQGLVQRCKPQPQKHFCHTCSSEHVPGGNNYGFFVCRNRSISSQKLQIPGPENFPIKFQDFPRGVGSPVFSIGWASKNCIIIQS